MSALGLKRTKRGQHTDQCSEPGCHRQGRFRLSLAGHIVPAESKLSMDRQVILCNPCAKRAKDIWNEYSGQTSVEETRLALTHLHGTASQRVDAIDTLRTLGYSKAEVSEAAKKALGQAA